MGVEQLRDATKKEQKWFARLKRCMDAMPDTVIISVCSGGEMQMHDKDEPNRAYHNMINHGVDADAWHEIDIFFPTRAEPRSETL